jgi:hypothetical protein
MGVRSDSITVHITSWRKFNPRQDVKQPSWFRVDFQLLEDPDFYDFEHEEFKAWLYILAQACRKNTGTVRINYAHAKAVSRISQAALRSAIEKLRDLELVTVDVTDTSRERNVDVTDTNATRRDETERNELRVSTEVERDRSPLGAVSEFSGDPTLENLLIEVRHSTQRIWIKTYVDDAWVRREILKAAAWLEANPRRRPKHFARFMGSWLSRGWEKERRTIPTNRPGAVLKPLSLEEL